MSHSIPPMLLATPLPTLTVSANAPASITATNSLSPLPTSMATPLYALCSDELTRKGNCYCYVLQSRRANTYDTFHAPDRGLSRQHIDTHSVGSRCGTASLRCGFIGYITAKRLLSPLDLTPLSSQCPSRQQVDNYGNSLRSALWCLSNSEHTLVLHSADEPTLRLMRHATMPTS